MISLLENKITGGATFVFVVTISIIQFLSGVPIFQWIWHNPLRSVVLFAAYMLCGTAFSYIKFGMVLYEDKEIYRERCPNGTQVPELGDYKAAIIGWIIYWPFSATWLLVHEPVMRSAKFLYRKFEAAYQGLINKVYADVMEKNRAK